MSTESDKKNSAMLVVDPKKGTTDGGAGKIRKNADGGSKLPKMKTEEERRASSREILKQIESLDLSVTHAPIRELLKLLKQYNETGDRILVNIPFPEMNRRIKGVLAPGAREDSYVVLKHEKF